MAAAVLQAQAGLTISPVTQPESPRTLARLANERVELTFLEAERAGKPSVQTRLRVRQGDGWIEAPVDASAESYQVVKAPEAVDAGRIQENSYYASWSQKGRKGPPARVVWQAGLPATASLNVRKSSPITNHSGPPSRTG